MGGNQLRRDIHAIELRLEVQWSVSTAARPRLKAEGVISGSADRNGLAEIPRALEDRPLEIGGAVVSQRLPGRESPAASLLNISAYTTRRPAGDGSSLKPVGHSRIGFEAGVGDRNGFHAIIQCQRAAGESDCAARGAVG